MATKTTEQAPKKETAKKKEIVIHLNHTGVSTGRHSFQTGMLPIEMAGMMNPDLYRYELKIIKLPAKPKKRQRKAN